MKLKIVLKKDSKTTRKIKIRNPERIINILLFTLTIAILLSKYPLVLTEAIGEADKPHHLHAYELTYYKSGNPVAEDFQLARVQQFIMEKPLGVRGVPVGWLMLFNDNYNIFDPNIVVVVLFIITAFTGYLIQKQNSEFKTPIQFILILLSARSFFSLVWGQFSFLISTPFIMLTIYYFNKYWSKNKKEYLIFTGLSLFVSLQTHTFVSMTAIFYIISVLINYLFKERSFKKIKIKFKDKRIKELSIMLIIAIIAQLVSFRSISQLVFSDEFLNKKGHEFNLIKAFIIDEYAGYPNWFFSNIFLIYGLMLILIPFGIAYAIKSKDYKHLIWFGLTFIYSRPSLIPLSHLQYRVTIFLPLIAAFIAVDGLKVLNDLFKKQIIKRAIPIVFSAGVMIMAFIMFPINVSRWSPGFKETVSWIDNNLENETITANFLILEKDSWWLTILTKNNVFTPIIENNTVVTTGYEDLNGNYNITYIIAGSGIGTSNYYYQEVVYEKGGLKVVRV